MAAALVPLAAPSTALAERWLRPVPGEVARTFDYTRAAPFARGAHRGADLAAAAGTAVRAACAGVVMHAGPVAGRDGVVSVRCGGRRVSYLPLDAITVRRGARVSAGTRLGAVAAGHGGLHFGVRSEADAFAYEDPLALLGGFEPPTAPLAPPRPAAWRRPMPRAAPRPGGPGPSPRPAEPRAAPRPGGPGPSPRPAGPRAVPRLDAPQPFPRPAAPRATPPVEAPHPFPPAAPPRRAPRGVAPWPVWVGLGLLVSGAAGSRSVALRRRRRRAALRPLRTTTGAAQ
jgi:hypothetical protein